MDAAPSLPGSMHLTMLFVHWGGLLLLSALLVFLFRIRRSILHPIVFVKSHRRAVAIVAFFALLILLGPPFISFAFSLSFSYQTTVQENQFSAGLSKDSHGNGVLQPRYVVPRCVALVPVGKAHTPMTRELANMLARQLVAEGRFDAVDVLDRSHEITEPEQAYELLLSLSLRECKLGGALYWRRANAVVDLQQLRGNRDSNASYRAFESGQILFSGLTLHLKHGSQTKGLCSRAAHRDIVLGAIAKELCVKILEALEGADA